MNWNELKHIDELKGDSLTKDLENIIIPNPFIYSLFSNYEGVAWYDDGEYIMKYQVGENDQLRFTVPPLSELYHKDIKSIHLVFTNGSDVDFQNVNVGFGVDDIVYNQEYVVEGDVYDVTLDLSSYEQLVLNDIVQFNGFNIVINLSMSNYSSAKINNIFLKINYESDLQLEKTAIKNRIEEFTESTYLKQNEIIDSGWINAELTNQFETYLNHTLQYRQIGGIVFVKGIVTPKSTINFPNSSTSVKICSLPETITPSTELFFLQTISATYKYRLEVKNDGLYISNPSNGASRVNSISSTAYLSCTCNYCLTEVLIGMINNVIESSSDYNTLMNKPKLNGQTLIGDTVLNVPNKTSDLVNDNGFITSAYHDNTKVDKISGKGLSTEDYTTAEKTKLGSLENYDDTDVKSDIFDLQNDKQDNLISGTNIKTINYQSLLGNGNITIGGGEGTSDYNSLENKPKINNNTLMGNLNSSDLGLANNIHTHDDRYYTEAEIDTALNSKANSVHNHTTDDIYDLSNYHDVTKQDVIETISTSGTYYVAYKTLNIVSVYVNRTNYSPTKNTWVTVGNLPEGFRPISDFYMEYQDYRMVIKSTGAIQVNTASTPINLIFNFTYII